jgi:hypothetical protein
VDGDFAFDFAELVQHQPLGVGLGVLTGGVVALMTTFAL